MLLGKYIALTITTNCEAIKPDASVTRRLELNGRRERAMDSELRASTSGNRLSALSRHIQRPDTSWWLEELSSNTLNASIVSNDHVRTQRWAVNILIKS